jgi:cholesterol transport system auxiliary component
MKKSKLFLTLAALFLLSGCISSSNYYVLSVASQPSTVYAHKKRVIGVEKVIIPTYLYKRQIAIAKSSSQIDFMSGSEWGEDLDEGLTHRLIAFFQKKFRQPRVYAYPWNTDTLPDQRVKVQITRFIAYGDRVYLDANWEVKNLSTGRSRSSLFNTSVPTTAGNAASIVNSMDAAFRQLEESIANGLKSF